MKMLFRKMAIYRLIHHNLEYCHKISTFSLIKTKKQNNSGAILHCHCIVLNLKLSPFSAITKSCSYLSSFIASVNFGRWFVATPSHSAGL